MRWGNQRKAEEVMKRSEVVDGKKPLAGCRGLLVGGLVTKFAKQPKSVHTRLVHSGGNFCVCRGGDFLHGYGDGWLIVEV